MEADLDARASVAGGALAAVQQANEKELASFELQSQAQQNQLLSSIGWEFRKVNRISHKTYITVLCYQVSHYLTYSFPP